jgi:hypothetical protein
VANTQAICTSFKVELMKAVHALGTPPAHTVSVKDTIKAALFFVTATRGAGDTVYNTTGEVTGTNYTAGGVTVTNGSEPTSSGTTAFWQPSASIVYTTVSIGPTGFDAVELYNSTQGDKAIAVYTFGSQTISAGTFTLTMPTPDGTTGLLRLA